MECSIFFDSALTNENSNTEDNQPNKNANGALVLEREENTDGSDLDDAIWNNEEMWNEMVLDEINLEPDLKKEDTGNSWDDGKGEENLEENWEKIVCNKVDANRGEIRNEILEEIGDKNWEETGTGNLEEIWNEEEDSQTDPFCSSIPNLNTQGYFPGEMETISSVLGIQDGNNSSVNGEQNESCCRKRKTKKPFAQCIMVLRPRKSKKF